MVATSSNTDLWTTGIPNKSPVLVLVSTIFLLFTTAFFVTRFTYRWKTKQRGWDDLMAGLAYLILVIMTAFLYASATYGFGKHRKDILPTFSHAMFYFYLYQILYKVIGGLTKLNFCFLYLRIFQEKNSAFHWTVLGTAVVTAMGTVAFTAGTIFQCLPIKYNWDKRIEGRCISNMAFWYSHAVFNTLMDMVVYALPIRKIKTLHVQARTRLGLIAIFALGGFTIAASLVRLVMLRDSARSTQDPTWGSFNGWLWTEIEANTSVICCCLPALRTLFVQFWRYVRGKSGPETPTNSQEAKSLPQQSLMRSQNRTEEATEPSHSTHYGNFTKIESLTPESYRELPVPPRTWLPTPFGRKRTSSSSSATQLTKAEEGKAVTGSTAPRISSGQIYMSKNVEVESNRLSRYGGSGRYGASGDLVSMKEMLRQAPPPHGR